MDFARHVATAAIGGGATLAIMTIVGYLRARIAHANPGALDDALAANLRRGTRFQRFTGWGRQLIKRSFLAHLILFQALIGQLPALTELWACGAIAGAAAPARRAGPSHSQRPGRAPAPDRVAIARGILIMPPRRAIILAAGYGSRMGALTADRPKALLEIDGWSLIDRQLDALRRCGIDDVTLVVGYQQRRLREHLGNRVTFVENPRYRRLEQPVLALARARDARATAPSS